MLALTANVAWSLQPGDTEIASPPTTVIDLDDKPITQLLRECYVPVVDLIRVKLRSRAPAGLGAWFGKLRQLGAVG
jgi:hypothetical protein